VDDDSAEDSSAPTASSLTSSTSSSSCSLGMAAHREPWALAVACVLGLLRGRRPRSEVRVPRGNQKTCL
jgi:hypothetical protein